MNFRNQLTLTFTGLTTVVLIFMGIIIYYFAEQYTRRQFFQRLMDRGVISAQMYLERDELSAASLQKIQRKYLQSLAEETLTIYDPNRIPKLVPATAGLSVSAKVFDRIDKQGQAEFWMQDKQAIGLWYEDNEGNFYIIVSAKDETGNSKLRNLQEVLLMSVLQGILVMVVAGHFFSRKVLQPIVAIVQEVNKIRASKLHLRVQERPNRDEIGNLVSTFNQMLERLETSFYMQKSFIANASHELRNPLTAIRGEIEVTLLKDRSVEEYKESLETLQGETARLEKLTADLILLAQTGFDEDAIRQDQVRIDEVLLEVKTDLNHHLPQNKIQVDLAALPTDPGLITVLGNRNLLQIAFKNVLENASKFSDHGSVQATLFCEENKVVVLVKDSGIGIPEQEVSRVMEPFYRANNARSRHGTGIGLAMTEKIMRLHDGSIQLNSSLESGTTVILTLPIASQ